MFGKSGKKPEAPRHYFARGSSLRRGQAGGNSIQQSKINNSGNSDKEVPQHETHFIDNTLKERKLINKLTKGRAGVYVLTNTLNGKQYVGSSINLITRISMYFMPSIIIS